MQIRFLLGPAGCGKTFRYMTEVRRTLEEQPEGPLLLFLAPKQATYQLERHLLNDENLPGYTRLRIVSFDRLAEFIFDKLEKPLPKLLSEEGRVMVLRALLGRKQKELKLFRASARLPGFAQQLGQLMRELQQHRVTAGGLDHLAQKVGTVNRLDHKLHDLALLLQSYLDWLREENLQDADALLDLATEALEQRAKLVTLTGKQIPALAIDTLWLDGFAQLTPQERKLLAALVPHCQKAALAFCLDDEPAPGGSWYSHWSLVGQTYRECHQELAALPGCKIDVEILSRDPDKSRFKDQPMLQHLEKCWADAEPFSNGDAQIEDIPSAQEIADAFSETTQPAPPDFQSSVRLVACSNPEAEATMVAREILRYVRSGGRFRDTAVLMRHLDQYHDPLRRVFLRYQIPFFLDRREPVAHHPLAELTRGALRTLAFGWRKADFFGALKSGLVHSSETEIDLLENEALKHGWEGKVWQSELKFNGPAGLDLDCEQLRQKLIEPFNRLSKNLERAPSGRQLAQGIRAFWEELQVGKILASWGQLANAHAQISTSIHTTVWEQMQAWLENIELAFAHETAPLAEWLPVLEAGLANLNIGVVPPVIDQVLLGSIDRSRNPDLQRVYVLGLNETIFPAIAAAPKILTETDRARLEPHGYVLGTTSRNQVGRERFYGYIACTRARRRVVLTYALRGGDGKALNPSSFISHVQRMLPALRVESFQMRCEWSDSEHPSELVATLLRVQDAKFDAKVSGKPGTHSKAPATCGHRQLEGLSKLPAFLPVLQRLRHLHPTQEAVSLSPQLAEQLYGPVLETSVSRLEQFAACPFRFFVNSGLQAEERVRYELDVRQQGSFQHEVLARFHDELRREHKKWRDLSAAQARVRIGEIADQLMPEFQQGMLLATEQNRFVARSFKESLQVFIEAIIGWMKQYSFDPEVVEIGFGMRDGSLPAWELDLKNGHALLFRGRIDRVDLWRVPGRDEAICVVMDYKSSLRKLDPLYLEHGLQQQLPAYLNMLRAVKNPQEFFQVSRIIPAGVFYINLRGKYEAGANRNEVLANKSEATRNAYMHEGLFDFTHLAKLDSRPGAVTGDQFNYRLKKDGQPDKRSAGVMNSADFTAMLDRAEGLLGEMGRRIYCGDVKIDPFKCSKETACDKCEYQGVCRVDSWTHSFRRLTKGVGGEDA